MKVRYIYVCQRILQHVKSICQLGLHALGENNNNVGFLLFSKHFLCVLRCTLRIECVVNVSETMLDHGKQYKIKEYYLKQYNS